MNSDALHLLTDLKNMLLGIAIMLVGLGLMPFGAVAVWIGGAVLLCGFAKVYNAWSDHKVVSVPDETSKAAPEKKEEL